MRFLELWEAQLELSIMGTVNDKPFYLLGYDETAHQSVLEFVLESG